MNDPEKTGKEEQDRRTTIDEDVSWQQTDHNLYRYGNWLCFVKKAGTFKTVELYFFEEPSKAYIFIGSFLNFKKVVDVISKAEAEKNDREAEAGS